MDDFITSMLFFVRNHSLCVLQYNLITHSILVRSYFVLYQVLKQWLDPIIFRHGCLICSIRAYICL